MSAEQWQNLAIAGVVFFFAAQALLDLYWNNFCGHIAIDYCAFWSAGHLARTEGYAAVYDLQRLEQIQRQVFPEALNTLKEFPVVPTPYLPVFLAPFALLEPLGPRAGYAVWTALNLLALYYYLRFFLARSTGFPAERRLMVLMLVAYPVFLNLFKGQVDIWLTICVGEFMRASIAGRPFRGGMWLAGLLIKPQYLALLGIALLMQRSARALAGFAGMSGLLLGLSYVLLGEKGPTSLVQLWLAFAKGFPSTGTTVMMNWRTVGLFLVNALNPRAVWVLIAVAMLITALAGLAPWRRSISPSSRAFPVAMLATLAATCAFAWHSHVSSAAILLCPLMMLYQEPRQLPKNALELWVLLPPAFQLASIALAGALRAGMIRNVSSAFVDLLSAIVPFGFNLFFVIWALRYIGEVDVVSPSPRVA
jgi:hypothetical protein